MILKKRGKHAQVWVETVVYTLIGLAILGVILAIAMPKIKQTENEVVIEQTLAAINSLNQKVHNIQMGSGNSRQIDFRIKEGELIIDSVNDSISFVLEKTSLLYSELGVIVPQGDIKILTVENGKKYNVHLILDYSGQLNITFENQEIVKELSSATNPYKLLIKNQGRGNTDISLI
jgi:type II secretory pathway pseudopilin PulG